MSRMTRGFFAAGTYATLHVWGRVHAVRASVNSVSHAGAMTVEIETVGSYPMVAVHIDNKEGRPSVSVGGVEVDVVRLEATA